MEKFLVCDENEDLHPDGPTILVAYTIRLDKWMSSCRFNETLMIRQELDA